MVPSAADATTVAVTLALYLVPYGHHIAYPLLLISTLVHELGHGVAAIMAGGDFDRFVMNWDGSGMAIWNSAGVGRLGHAFVSAGGLVGPAVAAAICFALARRHNLSRIGLGVFGFLAVAISVSIGTVVGGVAGYVGGKVDTLLMRLVDMVLSFPRLVLLIAVIAILENPSIFVIIAVLSFNFLGDGLKKVCFS